MSGTVSDVKPPPELLDEIREDLRHEGAPRCDRWFPEIEEGDEVLSLNLSVGLAWWTVALPIIKQARTGSRILVLDSPRPEAVGKVGILKSFDGFPCVDLQDGTRVRPLVQQAALLPAPVSS